MIKRQTLSDGRYVVVTTRRAAYTSYIFGKASIYKTKECNLLRDGWETVTNIRLGQTTDDLAANVDKFIASLERNA